MRFTIESKLFCSTLQFATNIVSEEVVLISATETEVIVEAGSKGTYFLQALPAKVEEQGTVVLNSQYITGLQLNANTMFETVDNNRLTFKSGVLKGTVETSQDILKVTNIRPTEELPIVATLPLATLKEAFIKTKFHNALGLAEGVRLCIEGNILKLSSSDFTRVSFYIDTLTKVAGECNIILPSTILGAILSKIKDSEINIGVVENCIQLSTASCQCVFPTSQVQLPDIEVWLKSVDEDSKLGEFKVGIEDLLEALSSVSSLKSNNSETVLKCGLNGNKLTIEVVANHGTAESSIMVFLEKGKTDFELESKNTLELLSVIKTGNVIVSCWETSIMIATEDGKALYVIPTRTNKEINRS